MGYYNKYGKAEVDPTAPRAFGVCQRCSMWFNLHKLRWQMQWNATQLYNTRFLVCDSCMDVPQQQLRALILPPDPPPLANTRVEPFFYDEVDILSTQDGDDIVTQNDDLIVPNAPSEEFPGNE